MVQAIKKQFQVQWKDWLWFDLIVLACGVTGMLVFRIIAMAVGEELEEMFALGTVIAGICAVIFFWVLPMVQMPICFNMQIAMGSTRKQFILSWLVVVITEALVAFAVVTGICYGENILFEVLYSGIPSEINFLPYLLRYGVPAAVVLPILGSFCGVLIMRFGRTAFWVLWALWMFLWLGLPNLSEAVKEAPNSLYGRIGRWLGGFFLAIPVGIWMFLVIAATVAASIGIYGMLRKQQVTG